MDVFENILRFASALLNFGSAVVKFAESRGRKARRKPKRSSTTRKSGMPT